jgi:hypothetical protein
MPTIPTVFRPIRSNDVQLRPFKTYKSYTINSNSAYSSSGYRVHDALHSLYDIYVGDNTYNYPTNSIDNTNQHVIWKGINHRYYQYPFDATQCHELTNNRVTEKYLHKSASVFTVPYFDVGEQIKPGSLRITGKVKTLPITLQDDGYGNLRDMSIITSSFASASHEICYITFNNAYRDYTVGQTIQKLNVKINNNIVKADVSGIRLATGVANHTSINTTSPKDISPRTGYLGFLSSNENGYIRIPHHDVFNRFNKTDNWTISFWFRSGLADYNDNNTIISKAFQYTDTRIVNGLRTEVTRSITPPAPNTKGSFNQIRTPFHIFTNRNASNVEFICFKASNGTSELFISGSISYGTTPSWEHCAIVNDGDKVRMYINGNLRPMSGSLPIGSTANSADIMLAAANTNLDRPLDNAYLGEIRMYDYAASLLEVRSLSNRHYISSSLYQSNVAGNVFYRNGQVVISSPLVKYNSGSGFFNNEWTASWKGTHTVYENEVMVRVPADQFNYTMNPSATYRPASSVDSTGDIEKYNGAGVLYKSMFTSSFINPYITSIGLYNDKAQLLAVGKLAQPVQKRDDIDMNIIVRWDY